MPPFSGELGNGEYSLVGLGIETSSFKWAHQNCLQHTSVLDQGTTNPFGQDQKCTSLQVVKAQSNESSSRYVVPIDEKLQRQKFLLVDVLETVRTVRHAYKT